MTILVEAYYILVWERLGCQLHSNAVVVSVTKDFKFVTKYWSSPRMLHRCNINYVLSQDQNIELSIDLLSQIVLYVLILLQYI